MMETARQIRSFAKSLPSSDITPFYDHATGDYDLWLDDVDADTWTFDHETGQCTLSSAGGFAEWFARRLMEQLT